MAAFLQDSDDFHYEEELSRHPYSVKTWWEYLDSKRDARSKVRYMLYERALKLVPGSYKLWHAYLKDRVARVSSKPITDPAYQVVNNTFERALVFMNKMPRIWLEYCEFLMTQRKATVTRRVFDRALQALPITQHDRVWPLYLSFVRSLGVWQTAVRVYRRMLMLNPQHREDFVEYLVSMGRYGEAAEQLAIIVNDDRFVSKNEKTHHQLWMELCDLISKHPDEVKTLKADPIIRSGLRKFTDDVGRLWCALADYYIRQGEWERARDVYEEGIDTVTTVRDFSMIFDAYAQFEESMVTAKMAMADEESSSDEEDEEGAGSAAASAAAALEGMLEGSSSETKKRIAAEVAEMAELEEEADDVQLRLERLERLLDRRPLLLSSVLLRQNPHNVNEWLKRIKLFKKNPAKAIVAYTEACKTVEPDRAVGKLQQLWVQFAQYYERHGDLANARVIFRKAVEVQYTGVNALATVWCEWAEMELRNQQYELALKVVQEAVSVPASMRRRGWKDPNEVRTVQQRVHRSTRLWTLYCDLEENLGTLDTTRAAYNRAIELRVASPVMIINYAHILIEAKYYEDAFKVYERGVALFEFPHVKEIWIEYLTAFVERYGGRKLERARDLFEQAVEGAPADVCHLFFRLYANLEEQYGLVRHMLSVYDRATKAVSNEQKSRMFSRYLRKAEEYYGVAKTRDIYERAIEQLPDDQVKDMCMRYASMERALGEIDRARAIYVHAAQFCDPRTVVSFWKAWHDFEVAHGNEDTYSEMARIKRTMVAQFSQVNYMSAEMSNEDQSVLTDAQALAAVGAPEAVLPKKGSASGSTKQLVRQQEEAAPSSLPAKQLPGGLIVPGSGGMAAAGGGAGAGAGASEANPEEISLDDSADAGADVAVVDVEQKSVPAGVFGDAKKLAEQQAAEKAAAEEPVGALDRFKKRRLA